jgi:hypothetical protein
LTRHTAISPAVTIAQKPSGIGLFSMSTEINIPTNVKNMATPKVKASADRPKDGR